MGQAITGVRNNGVIIAGLAALPGSTSMLVVTSSGLMEFQDIPSGSVAWADITGKPSEFTPASHNHSASDIVSGTLSDSLLSGNVAMRSAANTFTGLQTISEGVSNTTIRVSDDGLLISRSSDGTYQGSIVRGAAGTASSIAIDYDGNSGHYFKTAGTTRAVIHSAAVVTTGGVLSVNTISSNALTGSANSPITITTDDASGGSNGIVTNRTNRTAAGANAIQVWQYSGTEKARIRTDGGFVAIDLTATGLMCAGAYTVGTLPSASANAGKFCQVTDSSVTTFGSTVAGGGSNRRQVFSDGTNWIID